MGIIPTSLLHAVITPLHKGGSRTEPKQFRPVALTSHIIKVFERVVRKSLVNYLEENGLLWSGQHGFRALRSTLTQLLSHFDAILADLEGGAKGTDSVYLDFSKAFDKVDHGVVLRAIHSLGIHGKLGIWLAAFLSNRTQEVVIDGTRSTKSSVTSGVPQGTVLGPVLFLVLINNIAAGVNQETHVASFADDTRVSRAIHGH